MTGLEMKAEVYAAGVKLWELADQMKIHQSELSRRLRYELTDEQVEEIRQAVAQVKADSK